MDAACIKSHAGRRHRRLSWFALLLPCLTMSLGCRAIERHVIYNPDRHPKSWSPPTHAELAGLHFEDVTFQSGDGTELHGWFVAPANCPHTNAILFAHGRSGNIAASQSQLIEFANRNQAAVFVFDYRGYGKSAGRPSETGLYADTTAARDWLAARMNLQPNEVVLMGHSLGAAPIIDVAARDGARALVIESAFTSTPELLKDHTCGILSGKRLESCYNSAAKIGSYSGPVFISHGTKDRVIPFDHGIRLAKSATEASEVVFVKLETAHKTIYPDSYHQSLATFLRSVAF